MEQIITCISCPVGCRLKVTVEQGKVTSVSGNSCNRGIAYAKQECVAPKRMITAVVKLPDRPMPLSVKTESPIPKDRIFACMQEIGALSLNAPVLIGQVMLKDVCGTGVNVVATKSIE